MNVVHCQCLPGQLAGKSRWTEQIKVLAHRLQKLIVDYTIGFEVSSPRISVNEQRVQDTATRKRLHEFFRSLPGDRFPTPIALGEHVWLDNRDERFAAGVNALVDGLVRTQCPARST
ncbi:MAG: hypothetical protein ACRDTD_10740 [Pseudonocardiaceae bacterium]